VEEYTIEKLKIRFQKHAAEYEKQIKTQNIPDIPDAKFNLPRALAAICEEIENLKKSSN
jgi:hypothetical protein